MSLPSSDQLGVISHDLLVLVAAGHEGDPLPVRRPDWRRILWVGHVQTTQSLPIAAHRVVAA